MSDQPDFAAIFDTGDPDAAGAWLDAQPRRLHTFTPMPRPWGDEQWLPLHHATHRGHHELVKLLLQRGAQPDGRTRFATPFHARATAMHLAAQAGLGTILRLLLDADGQPELLDAYQATPLHHAARQGRAHAAALLLDAGVDPDRREAQDRTPLHLAIVADHHDPTAPPSQPPAADGCATVAALLAHGCDVNATCPKEAAAYTPLHRCVSQGITRLPTARLLINHGADLTCRDPRNQRTAAELAEHLIHQGETQLTPYLNLLHNHH